MADSTQNQALSAILFLYRHVLHLEIALPSDLIRAQKSKSLPVVLTHQEALLVISKMSGLPQLMAKLLYGGGLRVKDMDFGNRQVVIRDGKGEDDRVTILSDSLVPALQKQIETVRRIHQTDLGDGFGEVWLPYALERKYPNASRELNWQYLFPASALSVDPASKKPSAPPPSRPKSKNPSPRTPSVTPSPPTFSKTATISAPSRNSSATKTSKPP